MVSLPGLGGSIGGGFLGNLTASDILTAGGGLLGAINASRAGREQANALNRAAGISERQFDITRADLAPFREQGVNALNTFAAETLPPLQATPEFQFALTEGLRGLDQIAAARGKALSGQQIRGALRFGTGLASQLANNRLNRLAALAGIGQTATTSTGAFGANAANTIGNALANAGTARASGFVGAGNAISDSINNALLLRALR